MLNKLTEPVISLFLLPNQLEINDAQVYDTQLIFSHAAWIMGDFKDLYCSEEKGLSLLLKKRIRKTIEHALRYSTNVVDSRYYTFL